MQWLAACVISELKNARRSRSSDKIWSPDDIFVKRQKEPEYRNEKEKADAIFEQFKNTFN